MYNRTHQLQSLAEGFRVFQKYQKDCIIVVDDDGDRTPLPQLAISNIEEDDFGDGFKSYMINVDLVREQIKGIDEGTREIDGLLQESARAVTTEQNSAVSVKLNEIISKTNALCTKSKSLLEAIGKQKNDGSPTEARMRNNAHNVCLKHFQAAIGRYQDAQGGFKKAIKERTTRQIQLIYPDIKQEELEKMMKPGMSHSILEYAARSSILGTTSITDAVANIQSKYNDVLTLEESVEELHQMMVEMAGLVSYQGDLIDQVEHNAMKAVEYTEKTRTELLKAQRNKRRSSRIVMYFTIALTVGGIVVIVPLVIKLV